MMHLCIILTAIVCVIQALPLSEVEEQQWKEFTLTYEKQFENEKEESRRKEIFVKNLHKFADHNKKYEAGLVSYALGVNQFADMTPEEFSMMLTPMNVSDVAGGLPFIPSGEKLPTSIDWRKKGAVTPVKQQGRCGACYAFSTTGALEGQLFKKTGKLTRLSEQNIVDCSSKYGNRGCKGGHPIHSYRYIKHNGGIDTEKSYPYEGVQGECRYKSKNSGGTDKSYVIVRKGNEKALLNAVGTVGPVSIGVNGNGIQHYHKGVFEGACNPKRINHAVLIVGYGTTSKGKDYWIVKNSWGKRFGQNGYILLARNKNVCGLTAMPTPYVSNCVEKRCFHDFYLVKNWILNITAK